MVSKFRRDAGYICEEQTDAENLRKVPQKCTWFSWGYSARADVYHGVFIECGFYINFTQNLFILKTCLIIICMTS